MKGPRACARPAVRLRRAGPSPAARLNPARKFLEGVAAWDLHEAGQPFDVIGAQLGLSPTTAWRRAWWFWDSHLYPELIGAPAAADVVQRGTRECPVGSPWWRPEDSEESAGVQ